MGGGGGYGVELRGARDEPPLLMFTGKGLNEQDLHYALKGIAEACCVSPRR